MILLSKITSDETTRYTILKISKDGQFALVRNETTKVEKDWPMRFLRKDFEEKTIIENEDGTFSRVKTERKQIEY